MALKKIILNTEEINLPTKLSDLENDLNLGGEEIDTSNLVNLTDFQVITGNKLFQGGISANGIELSDRVSIKNDDSYKISLEVAHSVQTIPIYVSTDNYAICNTVSSSVNKDATLTTGDISLTVGERVTVWFYKSHTSPSMTLNVNNTGKKTCLFKGEPVGSGLIVAGCVYDFVYDGTYWQLLNIGSEIAQISISGNMTSSTFALTASEASAIVSAYDTGKTIVLRPTGSNFSSGWIVPTIRKLTMSTQHRLYISYYIGGVYGEVDAIYNTSTNGVTMNSTNVKTLASTPAITELTDPVSLTLSPNVKYVVSVATDSLEILAFEEPTELTAEYTIHFFIGGSAGSLTLPDEVLWVNGTAPTLEAGTAYELSVAATNIGGNYVYKAVLTAFKQAS